MTIEFKAAFAWAGKGFNVVPQKAVDKKFPAVKWKHLQSRLATQAELTQWRPMFANGVGFITGEISNDIVVESDGPEGEALLAEFEKVHGPFPPTLVIRSGSGRGLHRHFKHPGYKVKTVANPQIKLDIKGDGGFCVLPPSLHKSGGRYTIVHNAKPAELPPGLLEFIEARAREANGSASRETNENGPFGNAPEYDEDALGSNTERVFDKPSVETMRAMLEHLVSRDAFKERNGVLKDDAGRIVKVGWIETGMALKAAYGDAGFELWAITHRDDEARNDAQGQWAAFASEAK